MKFILLDGIDGAGKSTSTSMIVEILHSEGIKAVVMTPWETQVGLLARRSLIDGLASSKVTEALFNIAAFKELDEKINSLTDVDIVILDRTPVSTLVYQLDNDYQRECMIKLLMDDLGYLSFMDYNHVLAHLHVVASKDTIITRLGKRDSLDRLETVEWEVMDHRNNLFNEYIPRHSKYDVDTTDGYVSTYKQLKDIISEVLVYDIQ